MGKLRRGSIVVAVAVAMALPLVVGTGLPAAAACGSGALVPQLRDSTTNQGLGSYNPLIRGKEALVRFYISLPSCASTSDSIALIGASLTVRVNGVPVDTISSPVPALKPPYPTLPAYTAATVDNPADPIFIVPATDLRPQSTTGFSLDEVATLTYSANAGSSAQATMTLPAVSVAAQTHNIRVLLVPMGDTAQPFSTEFTSAGHAAAVNAMNTVSRIWPIPAGTGDLAATASPTPGLKYTISSTMVNTGPQSSWPNGKVCLSYSLMTGMIQPALAQRLQSWNAANPSAPADLIAGIVDTAISAGSSYGCLEGITVEGKPYSAFRVGSDGGFLGAIAAHELGHSQGLVAATMASERTGSNPYHSKNLRADTTAPNRAFNVPSGAYLSDNHALMNFSGTFSDSNTLFERDDWSWLVCNLGGPTSAVCTHIQVIGAPAG